MAEQVSEEEGEEGGEGEEREGEEGTEDAGVEVVEEGDELVALCTTGEGEENGGREEEVVDATGSKFVMY